MKKFISVILSFAVCFGFTSTAGGAQVTCNRKNCQNCSREHGYRAINNIYNVDIGKVDTGNVDTGNVDTEKITLSRLSQSDANKLKKYYKDDNIRYYLAATDKKITEQQALSELNHYNSGSNFTFAIKNKSGNAVGAVVLSCLSDYVNIAYWVIPEFRGHSYAAKACEALIREAHKIDPSIVFFIKLNAENIPSKNVVKKLKEALVDTDENRAAVDSNGMHYEIEELEPVTINYKIFPRGDGNYWFYIFENGRQTYSGICSKKQILSFTYKKIFDSNELELVRLRHFIRLVH